MDSKQNPPTITLKRNRQTGKYILPLNLLDKVALQTPPGFDATGLSIVVAWSATGVLSGLAETPPVLKPLDDIQRLFRANRMVGSVEALAQRAEKSVEAQKVLFRIQQDEPKVEPSQQFKAEAIRCKMLHEIGRENLEALRKNASQDPQNAKFFEFLSKQMKLIDLGIDKYLVHLAKGKREKLSLANVVMEYGVTSYTFGLLTSAQLNYPVLNPLRRLFFRAKILKGFRLTTEEMKNSVIIGENKFLLESSQILVQLINGIDPEKHLGIRTEHQKRAWLGFSWFAIPFGNRKADVRDLTLGQLNVPKEIQPLWVFNNFLLERYSATIPFGASIDGWLGRTIANAKTDLDSTSNLREQIEKLLEVPKADLLEGDTFVQRLNDLEYYGSPGVEYRKIFGEIVKADKAFAETIVDLSKEKRSTYTDLESVVETSHEWRSFVREAAAQTLEAKKPRALRNLAVTPLGAKSIALLKAIEREETFRGIREDLQAYLQSFRLRNMQDAAVDVLLAALQSSRESLTELNPWDSLIEGDDIPMFG